MGNSRGWQSTRAIVWADELTGNLHSERSAEIMDLPAPLNKEHDQAIIMVTHDTAVGRQTHRTVRMRDGRMEGDG